MQNQLSPCLYPFSESAPLHTDLIYNGGGWNLYLGRNVKCVRASESLSLLSRVACDTSQPYSQSPTRQPGVILIPMQWSDRILKIHPGCRDLGLAWNIQDLLFVGLKAVTLGLERPM